MRREPNRLLPARLTQKPNRDELVVWAIQRDRLQGFNWYVQHIPDRNRWRQIDGLRQPRQHDIQPRMSVKHDLAKLLYRVSPEGGKRRFRLKGVANQIFPDLAPPETSSEIVSVR